MQERQRFLMQLHSPYMASRAEKPAKHQCCVASMPMMIRILNSLAESNLLIGIISHVSELKEKIEKQIIVTKAKSGGSHVEIISGL